MSRESPWSVWHLYSRTRSRLPFGPVTFRWVRSSVPLPSLDTPASPASGAGALQIEVLEGAVRVNAEGVGSVSCGQKPYPTVPVEVYRGGLPEGDT